MQQTQSICITSDSFFSPINPHKTEPSQRTLCTFPSVQSFESSKMQSAQFKKIGSKVNLCDISEIPQNNPRSYREISNLQKWFLSYYREYQVGKQKIYEIQARIDNKKRDNANWKQKAREMLQQINKNRRYRERLVNKIKTREKNDMMSIGSEIDESKQKIAELQTQINQLIKRRLSKSVSKNKNHKSHSQSKLPSSTIRLGDQVRYQSNFQQLYRKNSQNQLPKKVKSKQKLPQPPKQLNPEEVIKKALQNKLKSFATNQTADLKNNLRQKQKSKNVVNSKHLISQDWQNLEEEKQLIRQLEKSQSHRESQYKQTHRQSPHPSYDQSHQSNSTTKKSYHNLKLPTKQSYFHISVEQSSASSIDKKAVRMKKQNYLRQSAIDIQIPIEDQSCQYTNKDESFSRPKEHVQKQKAGAQSEIILSKAKILMNHGGPMEGNNLKLGESKESLQSFKVPTTERKNSSDEDHDDITSINLLTVSKYSKDKQESPTKLIESFKTSRPPQKKQYERPKNQIKQIYEQYFEDEEHIKNEKKRSKARKTSGARYSLQEVILPQGFLEN